ncbi:MAG: acetyltransferase, partial [Streptococcus parasanguinis]|nr:acetyltransferase [Streptococcus parasanguinis]
PSLVHFKSAEKQGHVGIDLKTYHHYFNAVTWLNKGGEDLTK